jgi:hypothetical protein
MVEFPGATAVKITFDALTKLEVMCASEGSVTIKLHSFANLAHELSLTRRPALPSGCCVQLPAERLRLRAHLR